MPADIILEEDAVKVTDGTLETQTITSDKITTSSLQVHNEKDKLFIDIDGAKGQIRVVNQKGGGLVMTIKGIL